MPQKSAPELFAVVHYLHRLSTEGKRGAKMALESCPKCHFIMLEGVLMTIEEHGQNGTIYVSDLAAAVKQPLPAVSRALRQLEQDGLIERITDPNDRRKTLVRPTEKGLDASRQVEAAISRYFERVICRIPEEQREQLFSLTGSQSLINSSASCKGNKCSHSYRLIPAASEGPLMVRYPSPS